MAGLNDLFAGGTAMSAANTGGVGAGKLLSDLLRTAGTNISNAGTTAMRAAPGIIQNIGTKAPGAMLGAGGTASALLSSLGATTLPQIAALLAGGYISGKTGYEFGSRAMDLPGEWAGQANLNRMARERGLTPQQLQEMVGQRSNSAKNANKALDLIGLTPTNTIEEAAASGRPNAIEVGGGKVVPVGNNPTPAPQNPAVTPRQNAIPIGGGNAVPVGPQMAPQAPQPMPGPQGQQMTSGQNQALGVAAQVPQGQPSGNTYGYQSIVPNNMEAMLMGAGGGQPMPAPMEQPGQQSFMQQLGKGLMGQVPNLIQNYMMSELYKPQGGTKDWRTGLTFGATQPGSNPFYQQMKAQQDAVLKAQQDEAALEQEMMLEEFKAMMNQDSKAYETELGIAKDDAKRLGDLGVEMINNDMIDLAQMTPEIMNGLLSGDPQAVMQARTMIKPDVEKQLKEYARELLAVKTEDPGYQLSETDKDILSLIGVGPTANTRYARDTQLMSQDLANTNALNRMAIQNSYNTRQKGISLANAKALKDYGAGSKATSSQLNKIMSSSPENPVSVKLGGADYILRGPGMDVVKYIDGIQTTESWEDFMPGGAGSGSTDDDPDEEAGWWDGVKSFFGFGPDPAGDDVAAIMAEVDGE